MSQNKDSAAENVSPPRTIQGNQGRRRSSIAELFTPRPNLDSSPPGPGLSKASGSSMASALSQAQDASKSRRLSISTLGLSGVQPQVPSTPFANLRRGSSSYETPRRKSFDSESAIDDSDAVPPMSSSVGSESSARPNGAMSPVGRRFSFGAKAYGDARASMSGPSLGMSQGGGGGGGGGSTSNGDSTAASSASASPSNKPSSPPGIKGRAADGFNWTETLRSRAQRTSISAESAGGTVPFPALHGRNKGAAGASAPAAPVVSKPPPKAPDHFQERILKGDFYMD